jgi:hypothetical protein
MWAHIVEGFQMTWVSGEHELNHARRGPQEGPTKAGHSVRHGGTWSAKGPRVRLKPDTTYLFEGRAFRHAGAPVLVRFVTRNNTLANGVLSPSAQT